MKFGEKLREKRMEKGLSIAQLASTVGLTKRTVINYEQGGTYPRDRKIYEKLAEALGVDADYLHNENDEEFIAEAWAKYGSRGKKQAEEVMQDINGLFAGGDMADEDMDEFMRAVQESYWKAKEKNRQKYTRKDYRKG